MEDINEINQFRIDNTMEARKFAKFFKSRKTSG